MPADRDIFDDNNADHLSTDDNQPWFDADDGFADPESPTPNQTQTAHDSVGSQTSPKKGVSAKAVVAGVLGIAVLAAGGLLYTQFAARNTDIPADFSIPNTGNTNTGNNGAPAVASPQQDHQPLHPPTTADGNAPIQDLNALYKQPTETSYGDRPTIPMPAGSSSQGENSESGTTFLTTTVDAESTNDSVAAKEVPSNEKPSSVQPTVIPAPVPTSQATVATVPPVVAPPHPPSTPVAPSPSAVATTIVSGNYTTIQAGQSIVPATTATPNLQNAVPPASTPQPSSDPALLDRLNALQSDLEKAEGRNQELVSQLEMLTATLDSRMTALSEKVNILSTQNTVNTQDRDTTVVDKPVQQENQRPIKRTKERARSSSAQKPTRQSTQSPAPKETALKAPVSSSFVLRAATPQEAWIAQDRTTTNLTRVVVGQEVAGIGRVTSIKMLDGGRWVVIGTQGAVQ